MSFQTKLVLKKLSNERLAFSMPLSFKILSLIIALILFIFISFFSSDLPGEFVLSNIVPIILFLLSVLSTLYHERWIFDKNNNYIKYQFGLVFLYKSKLIKVQDIKHLELIHFITGKEKKTARSSTNFIKKHFNLLALRMKDGELLKVEFFNSSLKMESAARSIAEYCRLTVVSV